MIDSLNEASGCTDYNAISLNSLQCTVAEQIKKTPQKYRFLKIFHFWWFFLIISAMVHFIELRIFAL